MSQIRSNFATVKRLFYIFATFAVPAMTAAAQDSIAAPKLSREILEEARRDSAATRIIDLPLATSPYSRIDMMPAMAFYSPWAYGGPAAWSLHEGFNASVGFSVSAGIGKHRPKGAGFGEHFAAAYAMPFGKDKRWIGAVGVYADRLDWGSYRRVEAGLAGILGYNVNDWCNLYVYGAYNFVPGRDASMGSGRFGPNPFALRYPYGGMMGYGHPFDPYDNLRGRIGAAAEFKVGRAAAITVAFERDFFDNRQLVPIPPPIPDNTPRPFSPGDTPKSAGRGGNRGH